MIRVSTVVLILTYILYSLSLGINAYCEPPLNIKIGVALSLSGDCADVGSDSLKGLNLAVEEINRSGGILTRQVELVVEDTKESSSINAVTAFKKLTDDKEINFIIGPSCSSAALAIAPIARKLPKVVLISPSVGVREFVSGADNIFKLWPYDEDGPRLLAQYASKQNWKKVAIISSQQAWELAQGNFVAEAVTSFGGEVVAKVETLPNEPNLKAVVVQILRRLPDVVVLANYLQMDRAAIELARHGYKGSILTSLMTDDKIKLAEGKLESSISYGYPPAVPEFLHKFETRFGAKPASVSADTAYDSMILLKDAIVRAQTFDVEVIKRTLHEVREFMGASGKFSLDSSGGAIRIPRLFRVVGEQKVEFSG